MTNDELKKKIVDTMHPILNGTRVSCNEEDACEHCLFPFEVDRIADRLADALIAAGIGDVSKWKAYAKVHRIFITKDDKIKQLYSDEEVDKIVSERAEYKHRAEVAARALDLYLQREKNMRCWNYLTYDRNCDRNCEECWEGYFAREKQCYLMQAEKELAEEGTE